MGCGSSIPSKPAVAEPVTARQHANGAASTSTLARALAPAAKHVADAAVALGAKQAAGAAQSLASGQSVQEAGEQVVEEWEQKVKLLDSLLSGEDVPDMDNPEDDIDAALGVMEGVIKLFQPDLSTGDIDVQQLKLPSRSKVESALRNYGPVGKAVVSLASHAISALPFGAPVAAVLEGLYGRADQAAKNSKNCERLLRLVKECDAQIKKLAGSPVPFPDARRHIRRLAVLLVRSGHNINRYSGRNFALRFVTSGSDMATFQLLEASIRDSMQSLTLVVTMEVMTGGSYVDESAKLRAAVCKAAGLPVGEKQAQQALRQLGKDQPEKLVELLKSEGGFSDQLVGEALEGLNVRLAKVEARQDQVESRLDQLERKREAAESRGPPCMPKWMRDWWELAIGRLKPSVKMLDFLAAVVSWFKTQSRERLLDDYDAELASEGLLTLLGTSGQHLFMRSIVLPLLDSDRDGLVTRSELLQLELLSHEFAKAQSMPDPDSLPTLLDAVYLGFDRKSLAQAEQLQQTNHGALDKITAALQVKDMIHSYGIASLLDEYHRGSRAWMYDKVNLWLDDSLAQGGPIDASRLFLLLADAGMGKSVFSGVMSTKLTVRANRNTNLIMIRHFFKVGQLRAQGKAALLCLVQQLAEQLPGFADQLLPVVEQHGNAAALSMLDTFDSFLQGPLSALDQALPPGSLPHCVLMVLDALDEADDGGRGWQPVTAMIAKEFHRLPTWVKVLLTSRPQVQEAFKAWDPVWIKPEAEQNQRDMYELLQWRLVLGGRVAAADVDAAAQMLLRKSEGQFIYSKYVFEELDDQTSWTLGEMEVLPGGLQGMFRRVMDTLCDALRQEAPDMLQLLQRRLLPVLVVAREPLTVQELAWAVAGDRQGRSEADLEQEAAQVSRLVALLAPLFPTRAAGSSGELRVVPYHKSVLDWLNPGSSSEENSGSSAQGKSASGGLAHAVDVAAGHRLLAEAAVVLVGACSIQALEASMQLYSSGSHQLSSEEMPALLLLGGCYALHHAVAHTCLAAASIGHAATTADSSSAMHALLRQLLLLPGFWQQAFGAGVGLDVVRDLCTYGPTVPEGPDNGRSFIKDVIRWLRCNAAYLARYPRATMQLAVDAPSNSLVAKAAAALPYQPPARLLTKEADWPALLATFLGHTCSVSCVAITPDGKSVVSASSDKTLRVWDAESGEVKGVLEGHTAAVTSVVCSSDGKTIVSGSKDRTVRMWDLVSGQEKSKLEGHTDGVNSVAISPDGTTIVSGSDDTSVRVWDMLTAQQKSVLEGHSAAVNSVAISPDGKTIVSGSGAHIISMSISPDGKPIVSWSGTQGHNTVRVWDALTGQQTSVLEGHTNQVGSVAISPDGKTIVSGSDDKTVRVWDMFTGQQKSVLKGHKQDVHSVAISPDGTTIVSGSRDRTVRVWDMLTGQQKGVLELDGGNRSVTSVAISPDGKTIVSGSEDKTVHVWDALTGQQKSVLKGHTNAIRSVAISSDGKTIVSGSADWTARVWDMLTGQQKSVLKGHSAAVNIIVISPDGKAIVSGSGQPFSHDNTVRVWDMLTGQQKSVLEGHTAPVNSVAISPDGKTIVSGSGAEADGCTDNTVRVWDWVSGEAKSVLKGHTKDVTSVAISPDGKTIVSGSDDQTVRVWDSLAGPQMSVLKGHTDCVLCAAISPDGITIVSGSADTSVRMWDALTGKQKSVLEGHTNFVGSVAISPDGKTMVTGSRDDTVRVWDMLTGQQKSALEGHTNYIRTVAISPDGTTIVSGSNDKTVRVWDMLTGQQKSVLEGHASDVKSVAISPDGKIIVSGSHDKTVRVWDMLTGQQKSVLEGHTREVPSVAISPDGKTIVSGSYDKTVRVWDMLTGQQKSVLEGHTEHVSSVAISPDGTTIVSGSDDRTVRVWDMLTGQQKSVLEGHTYRVSSVAISPDGTTIVSGSGDRTVRVWGMEDVKEKEVHSGEDAKSKLESAQAWGKSAADQMFVTKSSDGNGQVVDLFSSSADKSIATVYITPPFQLDTSCMFAAGASRRLAAFTKNAQFLCYELVSFGLEA